MRQQVRLAQPVVYVVLVHVAAVLERPDLAIGALAVVCGMSFGVSLTGGGWRVAQVLWAAAGAVTTALAVAAHEGWHEATYAVLIPPVLANLYFLNIFGRTLLPGRVPLITHFSRINLNGNVPEPLVSYTRTLTILWTALFAAMALEAALLAAYADLETWSWAVNVFNPVLALAFFVLEHVYRVYRYSRFGPFSLLRAIRIMSRPDTWISANAETRG